MVTENEIIAKAYCEAADTFETYASDQIACKRFHSTKREKDACDLRASIWSDAGRRITKRSGAPVKQIYMVIGCPGSGKSWVCDQLRDVFEYVRHDDYIAADEKAYVAAIVRQAEIAAKPLLIETPFSISQVKDPLEKQGFVIVPLFIQEPHGVIRERYSKRGSGDLPAGHLSRQLTYKQRAHLWQAYQGTSAEVLAYLRGVAPQVRATIVIEQEAWPWQ